jgi:F-type H+-transporting ATPase subunit delta
MAVSDTRIAKRYARALFELTPPAQFEAISAALGILAAAWKADSSLRQALLNPAITQSARAAVLNDLLKLVSSDQNLSRLLLLLLENKRLEILPALDQLFAKYVAEYKKLRDLEVTSAFTLSEDEKREIQQSIEKKCGTLTITWKVDSTLIGGLLIRCGDKLLDSTIRGSLERVRTQLIA